MAVDSTFARSLNDACCRRVTLDEALGLAEKFLESASIGMVNRGMKLEQNSVAFHMLSVKALVLEKVRAELVSRNLCPVTLHSLSSLFAISYCSLAMCVPM